MRFQEGEVSLNLEKATWNILKPRGWVDSEDTVHRRSWLVEFDGVERVTFRIIGDVLC
jgi:hypothetical protein